ncbi:MAG: TAXI family TRAP transporter solute-binding subunit [Burkholderiaceae bacterium]
MSLKKPSTLKTHQYLLLTIKEELLAIKEVVLEQKLLVIILLAGLITLFYLLGHISTKEIILVADQKDSSWYQIAENARKYVEAKGFKYSIRTSNGTVENAMLLKDSNSGVNVAFLIPGALNSELNKSFYSLGSFDYEPIWIFYRKGLGQLSSLRDLAKYRVGVGPILSGRYVVTEKIFSLNKVEIRNNPNFIPNTLVKQLEDFDSGKLDVLIFIGQAYDPNVRKLANNPILELYDFSEADAYTKNIPFLQKVVVPAGSFDIAERIPNKTTSLIAITTNLAVRKDADPNVQLAILMAIKEAERGTEKIFFAKRNEFPSYIDPLIEISPVAQRFYDYGPPFLLNYFPFWAATLIDRFSVFLLAILAILFPIRELAGNLMKIRLAIYENDHYAELIAINRQVTSSDLSIEALENILERLKHINEKRANQTIKAGKEARYFSFAETIGNLQSKIEKLLMEKKKII